MTTVAKSIGMSLTKDNLVEATNRVRALERELDDARQTRNTLVITALDLGLPITQLCGLTGLGRNTIYRLKGTLEGVE